MARTRRVVVFLDEREHALINSVTPTDESLGKTLRRLATKQAEWYAQQRRKFKPALPIDSEQHAETLPEQHDTHERTDLDYGNTQDSPQF